MKKLKFVKDVGFAVLAITAFFATSCSKEEYSLDGTGNTYGMNGDTLIVIESKAAVTVSVRAVDKLTGIVIRTSSLTSTEGEIDSSGNLYLVASSSSESILARRIAITAKADGYRDTTVDVTIPMTPPNSSIFLPVDIQMTAIGSGSGGSGSGGSGSGGSGSGGSGSGGSGSGGSGSGGSGSGGSGSGDSGSGGQTFINEVKFVEQGESTDSISDYYISLENVTPGTYNVWSFNVLRGYRFENVNGILSSISKLSSTNGEVAVTRASLVSISNPAPDSIVSAAKEMIRTYVDAHQECSTTIYTKTAYLLNDIVTATANIACHMQLQSGYIEASVNGYIFRIQNVHKTVIENNSVTLTTTKSTDHNGGSIGR